jgi:hypothetical protein
MTAAGEAAHKRVRPAERDESDQGERLQSGSESDSECQWTPSWDPDASGSGVPAAKRKRLLQMSELYRTLRESVLAAVEDRRRRDAEECARSLEIARRHPLAVSCEASEASEGGSACGASSPAADAPAATRGESSPRISPQPSTRRVLLGKHTPCLTPSKSSPDELPGLCLIPPGRSVEDAEQELPGRDAWLVPYPPWPLC